MVAESCKVAAVTLKVSRLTPLAKQRLVIGKTQAEMARVIGFTKSAYSQIESGRTRPHPHRVADMARAFGIDVESFVELIASAPEIT